MPFWSDVSTVPKRNHRFLVSLGALGAPQYTVKTVSKPKFSVNNVEHNFLSHKFNFPGIVSWDPVSMTVADGAGFMNEDGVFSTSAGDNNAENFYAALITSGYITPSDMSTTQQSSFSKSQAAGAAGKITISQIGDDQTILDRFELISPWIESVDFGSLSYEDDGITEIQLSFRYDYATFMGINATGA